MGEFRGRGKSGNDGTTVLMCEWMKMGKPCQVYSKIPSVPRDSEMS